MTAFQKWFGVGLTAEMVRLMLEFKIEMAKFSSDLFEKLLLSSKKLTFNSKSSFSIQKAVIKSLSVLWKRIEKNEIMNGECCKSLFYYANKEWKKEWEGERMSERESEKVGKRWKNILSIKVIHLS